MRHISSSQRVSHCENDNIGIEPNLCGSSLFEKHEMVITFVIEKELEFVISFQTVTIISYELVIKNCYYA